MDDDSWTRLVDCISCVHEVTFREMTDEILTRKKEYLQTLSNVFEVFFFFFFFPTKRNWRGSKKKKKKFRPIIRNRSKVSKCTEDVSGYF